MNKILFVFFVCINISASEGSLRWKNSLHYDQLNERLLQYDNDCFGTSFLAEKKPQRRNDLVYALKKIFCPCLLPQKEQQSVSVSYTSDGKEEVVWGDD